MSRFQQHQDNTGNAYQISHHIGRYCFQLGQGQLTAKYTGFCMNADPSTLQNSAQKGEPEAL